MRSRSALWLLAALASVLVGCGDDGEEPTTASTAPPIRPEAAAVEGLDVELLDPGEAPRRRLTLDLTEAQSWEGTLRFDFDVTQDVALTANGPSRIDVLPTDDPDRADAAAVLGPVDLTVVEGDGPRQVHPDAATFSNQFALASDRTVGDVQSTVAVDPVLGEGGVGPVDPSLPWFIFTVPDEEIGEGAVWRVTGDLVLFGTTYDLTAEAAVAELGRATYRLELEIALEGPEAEGAPPVLEGDGILTGDPARVGPETGTVTVSGGDRRLQFEVVEDVVDRDA